MWNNHVLTELRSSKRAMPRTTAIHVSCTTSSATAWPGTKEAANAQQGAVIALDEGGEGRFLAGLQPDHEVVVVARHGEQR